MFDLFSKVDEKQPFNTSIRSMLLLRALMVEAGIAPKVADKFASNSGALISEKVAKEIADRLEGYVAHLGTNLVERKTMRSGQLTKERKALSDKDRVIVSHFIKFNRARSPYEIWSILFLWKFGSLYLETITKLLA